MDAQRQKISVYSVPDLKNTTDDALSNYLNSLNFKQSHLYTDVRHALGYAAVSIAAATFYFDYKLGWEKTKTGTLWAVVVYFILNGLLTLWIWGVEKGCVYVGERQGSELVLHARQEKFNPTYFLTARYRSSAKDDWHVANVQSSFTRWFDEEGHLVARPFQQWLAREIPVVGSAESARAGTGSGDQAQQDASSMTQSALETTAGVAEGSRRREKQGVSGGRRRA